MATAQNIYAEAPRRQDNHPGEVLLQHNLAADALPHLLKSASCEPDKWSHQVNLCIAYRKLGRYEESRQHIVKATQLAPEQWPVFHAWGQLLDEVGKFDDALHARLAAWDLCRHQSPQVAFALAWSLLRKGDWLNAWPLYEAGRYMRSWAPPPGLTVWDGTGISGKRLLVMSEGGYGDTFMFSRWLPNLHGSGVDVTLYVWDKQIPLLQTSPELDGIKFLPMSGEIDTREYDYVTSVMSLPALMQATPDTLPPSITFPVEPLPRNGTRRLGICWSAEEFGVPRKTRSLPAQRVEVLSGIEAEWFSLVPGQALTWMEPCRGNWLDDARLIKSLDTVISCDTSVLHLAGCLGVPTIGILPVYSAWTWLSERSDTPWYHGVTLVRGKKPDQWEESIAEVSGILNGA